MGIKLNYNKRLVKLLNNAGEAVKYIIKSISATIKACKHKNIILNAKYRRKAWGLYLPMFAVCHLGFETGRKSKQSGRGLGCTPGAWAVYLPPPWKEGDHLMSIGAGYLYGVSVPGPGLGSIGCVRGVLVTLCCPFFCLFDGCMAVSVCSHDVGMCDCIFLSLFICQVEFWSAPSPGSSQTPLPNGRPIYPPSYSLLVAGASACSEPM